MNYVIGSFNNYSFVYNSDDSSCKMIKSCDIDGLGYENKYDNEIDLYKLCTLCGISKFDRYAYINFVERNIYALGVYIIRSNFVSNSEEYKWYYASWHCGRSYLVFVVAKSFVPDGDLWKSLLIYNSVGNVFMAGTAILIPPVMLIYLLSCYKVHRLDLIKDALCNLVSDYDCLSGFTFSYKNWRVN